MNIRNVASESGVSEKDAWYLVQCKSRQDQRAEENLLHQGHVCARPICHRERVVLARLQSVQESLVPGYLFINLPPNADWSPLRSTRGVSRLVIFGGTPSDLVAHFQKPVESVLSLSFTRGDNVKILDGGFADLDAVFLTMDGGERAIRLIDFLSRQRQVSLPLAKNFSDLGPVFTR